MSSREGMSRLYLDRSSISLAQDHRVDHHAVAHHIDRLFVENARGDGVQYVFYPAEFQRVSGVGAALETGDDVVAGREHVTIFSFAFVSPLETQKKIDCHDMRYVFSVVSYTRSRVIGQIRFSQAVFCAKIIVEVPRKFRTFENYCEKRQKEG